MSQIREYLGKKYTRVDSFPSMFILDNYNGFETTKQMCDDLITDMYVVKGLTYITLEKEDPTLDNPNILRVFSYTRGLDFPSPKFIDDLIEAKYGERLRFFDKEDNLNTILGWQSEGIWRAGVQFLEYELEHDLVDEVMIEAAIEFSEKLATVVSSITIQDLSLLKSDLKRVTVTEALETLENLQARYFEICVQEFLRAKYGYSNVITRYKPPYLKGKEIDVYARKDLIGERKVVTFCECKLRFEKREIQLEDVADFLGVTLEVRHHESKLTNEEGGSSKTEAMLITNSIVSPSVLETLRKNDIRVMIAILPSNWRKRGDWKITEMKECK